jgi:uncharacterized protein YkwD
MLTMPRSLLLPAIALAASASLAVPASAASAGCAGADQVPTAGSLATSRAATLCLINAERAERGLQPLKANGKLTKASGRHSRDMVRRRYFDHVDPGGRDMTDRLRAVGYGRCRAGENIAWGPGANATPRKMVRMWMESAPHRRNILDSRYRALGLGVAVGSPNKGADDRAATYTTVFAAKG